MNEAVKLLLRDIAPAQPGSPATNVVQLPGTEELPTSQFPIVAVADVIICECRLCKACGSVRSHTGSRVHRLLSNCAGDPHKKVLRLRKKDEPPLDRRVVKVVEVLVDHCTECWEDNCTVAEAYSIEPPAPPRPRLYPLASPNASGGKSEAAKAKRATINQMTAEQAAEFL